jgi:hypothetical protein
VSTADASLFVRPQGLEGPLLFILSPDDHDMQDFPGSSPVLEPRNLRDGSKRGLQSHIPTSLTRQHALEIRGITAITALMLPRPYTGPQSPAVLLHVALQPRTVLRRGFDAG